jgi:hypothetical protein
MVQYFYCATSRCLVSCGILLRMQDEEVLSCILTLVVKGVNGTVYCLCVFGGALCEEYEFEVWVEFDEHL